MDLTTKYLTSHELNWVLLGSKKLETNVLELQYVYVGKP